jgi:hypothetical protein
MYIPTFVKLSQILNIASWGHIELDKHLFKGSNNLKEMPYDWSIEFVCIQNVLVSIINKDVIAETKIFYSGKNMTKERATRLQRQTEYMTAFYNSRENARFTKDQYIY